MEDLQYKKFYRKADKHLNGKIKAKHGKKLGRPTLTYPDNWKKVYADWKDGKITAKVAMELTETKRTSFYNLV